MSTISLALNTGKQGHSRLRLDAVVGAIPDMPKTFHTSKIQEHIRVKSQAEMTISAINGVLGRIPNMVKCLDTYSVTKDLEWRH